GKSIIEILVKSGFEVYLIDWGYPTDADKNDGLDVHVNLYIDRMVDKVRELSRQDQVTLLGYCMGGAMSMMYTALHQEKVKNLVTLATPFDFGASENILSKWGRDLPVEDIVNTFGNCPGWFLNMGFDAMKPFDKIDKVINITDGIMDDDFRTLFTAMEKWVSDAVSVPGKAYEEFLRGGFRENRLMKNEFCVGEQMVDLKKITCSYLNLVAEKDTLVLPVSSLKIGDYLGSEDKKLMTSNTGHIGLAVSGKTLKTLWPEAAAWMKERSGGNRKVAKRLVEQTS
ncbi:MAG TPA: alpha/beta fold hydrolase, partial [Candidatus Ozemobacteraceae bacterium]|nr:alpha/beta fold hydrolase [Candidatus Ozemobacteraceae bacterium]